MGILQWLDTREIDELAQSMVAELVRRVPPVRLESQDAKAAKQLWHTHQAVFSRAEHFARSRRLNIYQKARLGNQFRWGLKEAAYPPDFVESWTYELVTLVAATSTTRKEVGR